MLLFFRKYAWRLHMGICRHAVYHENEKVKYTYGGDHGEEKHDGNFCMDGLFFPDRTPHSGAKQRKIAIALSDAAKLQITDTIF